MWCAALPCARDFAARLDGTAVVRMDRPALEVPYGIRYSKYNRGYDIRVNDIRLSLIYTVF
jgi:hypothetical protein